MLQMNSKFFFKILLNIKTIEKVRSKNFSHLCLTILPFQFSINEDRIVINFEIYKPPGMLV